MDNSDEIMQKTETIQSSRSNSPLSGHNAQENEDYDTTTATVEQQRKRRQISRMLKRLGICLILLSILCIAISIPLSLSLHPMSVGSGFWCSVFIFFYGIFIRSSADLTKSRRVILSFGFVATYFALLMFALEAAAIVFASNDRLDDVTAVVILHSILAFLSALETGLASFSMVIYCVHQRHQDEKGSSGVMFIGQLFSYHPNPLPEISPRSTLLLDF